MDKLLRRLENAMVRALVLNILKTDFGGTLKMQHLEWHNDDDPVLDLRIDGVPIRVRVSAQVIDENGTEESDE